MKNSEFLILVSVIFISMPLMAQNEEVRSLSTDRPMQSETPVTVPKRHFQFEMGAHYQYQKLVRDYQINRFNETFLYRDVIENKNHSYSAPNLLFKYGLLDRLELRLNLNFTLSNNAYYGFDYQSGEFKEIGNVQLSGLNSPYLGFKYQILKEAENGIRPALSISVHTNFPSGKGPYILSNWSPVSRLTLSKTVIGSWYVSFGAGFSRNGLYSDQTMLIAQTGIQVVYNLVFAIEYYNVRDFARQVYFQQSLDAANAALIYGLGANSQIDLSAGTGSLSGQREKQYHPSFYNFYVEIGYSLRLGL